MTSKRYDLYIQQNIALAASITFKLGDLAYTINEGLRAQHPKTYADDADPYLWKYHLHLAGLYHWSDETMLVVSLDDLKTISFDKDTLATHPYTKEAYQWGSDYCTALLQKYPKQRDLALGILYAPDDPDYLAKVVNATDGDILYYPPQYIQAHETELLPKLQIWLTSHLKQWYNRAYAVTDQLYACAAYAQVTSLLIQSVMSLRLAACKTHQAHSFYVREYLASHAGLDIHMDTMTDTQVFFLYRNLPYLRNNVGRTEVFRWLTEEMISARDLRLYSYKAKHDSYSQLPDLYHPNRLSYTPTLQLGRYDVLKPTDKAVQLDMSLANLESVLDTVAPGNSEARLYAGDDAESQFLYAKSAVTQTKVLQSLAYDWSDHAFYTLTDVAITHWGSMALTGHYHTLVSIEIDAMGTATLPVAEAYWLYLYCLHQYLDGDDTMRPAILQRVMRSDALSLSTLLGTDSSAIDTSAASCILSLVPSVVDCYTPTAFYDNAARIYASVNKMHAVCRYIQHIPQLMQAQRALYRTMRDVKVMPPMSKWSDWLSSKALDLSTYRAERWLELAAQILDRSTALGANRSVSIKQVQAAMLAVMGSLSSYSVLYTSDVNETSVKYIQMPLPRNDSGPTYGIDTLPMQIDVPIPLSSLTTTIDLPAAHTQTVFGRVTDHPAEHASHSTIGIWGNMQVRTLASLATPAWVPAPSFRTLSDASIGYNQLTEVQKLQSAE